jgi:segregation and condensation protein A
MTVVAHEDGRLRLDVFEGPLDLLLYLIRKNEIDIHDIPIADITAQYQAILEAALRDGLLDLDFAGEYFLLAATLIQIKAKLLLPQPTLAPGEVPPEDPRRALVEQLLEHERFREAAMLLHEKAELCSTQLLRPEASVRHLWAAGDAPIDADLLALARAFQKVLEDRRLRQPHVLAPTRYTVREQMRHVLSLLRGAPGDPPRLPFLALFVDGTLEEAIATFLALLELVKRNFVRVRQEDPLGDIDLELAATEGALGEELLLESEFDRPSAAVEVAAREDESASDGEVVDEGLDTEAADDDVDADEGGGDEAPRDEPLAARGPARPDESGAGSGTLPRRPED